MRKTFTLVLTICFLCPLTSFSQSWLTDSLIAYYPFTGNANDSSGNGNNGTVFGASLAPDRFGNANSAYSFNGTSDYINYKANAKFKPSIFPISFTLWIKSNSTDDIAGIFKNDYSPNIYTGAWLQINPAYGGVIVLNYGDGGPNSPGYRRSKAGTTNVNDNKWHFVAGVIRDSTNMDIYIDCKYETGSYDGSGGHNFYSANPGNSGHLLVTSVNYYYKGLIDDIRYYHRALTQTDLQLIYSYPKPFSNLSVNLGSDTSISCSTGNAVTLVPNVSGNALAYKWSNSSTATSITVSQAGNYSITVYDGCRYASDLIAVKKGGSNQAGILTSSRDSICEGSGLTSTLNLRGSSGNLQWLSSTNGNSYSIIPGATDSVYTTPHTLAQTSYYHVVAENGNCTDTSNTVIVRVLPAPFADFTFGISGNQATFNSAGSSSDVRSFSWDFGDGSQSNLTNPAHIYARKDTFYVCLTVYNGSNCSYTFCQYTDLINAGVNNVKAKTSIQLYPNPVSDLINLYNEGLQGKYLLKVYNVLGQEVKQQQLTLNPSQSIPVYLNGFTQGTYELILFNDHEYYNCGFVLLK